MNMEGQRHFVKKLRHRLRQWTWSVAQLFNREIGKVNFSANCLWQLAGEMLCIFPYMEGPRPWPWALHIMMMKGKTTPEDKLLNIIEDPSARRKKLIGGGRKAETLQTWRRLRQSILSRENLRKVLKLRTINRILMGICVFLLLFLVIDVSRQGMKYREQFRIIEKGEDQFRKLVKKQPFLEVDLAESFEEAKRRNIFSFTLPMERLPLPEVVPEAAPSAVEEGLLLVGIIWSESRPQVMIEDAQAKTHLLAEDAVINDWKVKDIQRDHVVMERDGKEWVLR